MNTWYIYVNKYITNILILTSAGFQVVSSATVATAVHRVLLQLYLGQVLPTHPVTDLIPTEDERNSEIYQRYVSGERATDLAEVYGVSLQRIYILIRRYHYDGKTFPNSSSPHH